MKLKFFFYFLLLDTSLSFLANLFVYDLKSHIMLASIVGRVPAIGIIVLIIYSLVNLTAGYFDNQNHLFSYSVGVVIGYFLSCIAVSIIIHGMLYYPGTFNRLHSNLKMYVIIFGPYLLAAVLTFILYFYSSRKI